MDTHSAAELLLSFGVLGCIAALLTAGFTFLYLPVWAIVDCASSQKDSGTKTAWIIVLLFFWGISSLVYAVFAGGPLLRRVGILTTAAIGGFFILSAASCAIGGKLKSDFDIAEEARRKAEAYSESFPSVAKIDLRTRVRIVEPPTSRSGAAYYAEYHLGGPANGEKLDMPDEVRAVVLPPVGEYFYGLKFPGIVRFPRRGDASEISTIDPPAGIGGFSGLSWDSARNRLLVASHWHESAIFAFEPNSSTWAKLSVLPQKDITGLAYDPSSDTAYLLNGEGGFSVTNLINVRLGTNEQKTIPLVPPIPVQESTILNFQLVVAEGRLVASVPITKLIPEWSKRIINGPMAVFSIDLSTGRVSSSQMTKSIVGLETPGPQFKSAGTL